MTRRLVALLVVLSVLGTALAGVSYAGISDIYGTAHDLGSAGNPTCQQCHTPHDAQGDYLWARPPKTGMLGQLALCFSCHDGTVTNVGQFVGDPSYINHAVNPGVDGQDCDRCHDPHENNWKFVTDTSIPAQYRNANLCGACHNTGASHPLTTTSLPVDRVWDPYTTPADFSGTRLFDSAGSAEMPAGTGYIKCATCHTPHGAVADTGMNTMALYDGDGREVLCGNCHY